jgi:general secretion pathway protein N
MSETEVKPLIRPGKLILLLLAGVLVYAVTLILTVPIGWVWSQMSNKVNLPPGVRVESLAGTVWKGQGTGLAQGIPLTLGWDLHWPSLTELALPLDFSVASGGSALRGELVVAWPGTARVNATGQVNVDDFEPMIRRAGGALIEGVVRIDNLELAWDGERVSHARGMARWPGGTAEWPGGSASFPPMQINLDRAGGGVSLVVAEQGGKGPAARADVFWDGMMEVQVYKRLADLAGMNVGAGAPSDAIFKVRQPLLPGGGF